MKLVILLINSCFSLKAYYSTPKQEGTFENESGLKYSKPQNQSLGPLTTNSLTFCIRFYYKTLDAIDIFQFMPLSNFHIVYPKSFFTLALTNDEGLSVSSSWILKNPVTNEFDIWLAFKWHHFCFAYQSNTSYISVVKVRIEKKKLF